jgi:gamma-glutamyltranspeptidase / glutathione hydrolase
MKGGFMIRSFATFAAITAVITAPLPALAQEQGQKPAVRARSAMASSSNPTVTNAMVEVMRKGGNALDAVLTAVPMQGVIEPQMTTLAGGVSILYYEAKSGKYHYLDAELDHTRDAITAAGWTTYTAPGGERIPETSGKRIGIPGSVAGMKAAADRFGTLKWADYFQPAIRLAEQGYPMYSFLYGEMADAAQGRLAVYPSGREEYLPNGYVPPVGTIVKHPRLAQAMRRISAEGPAYIYSGEWAQHFVAAVRATGGGITAEELAAYKPRWEEPVRSTYKGFNIVSAPPPSTAGTLIGMVMNFVENYELAAHPYYADSAETLEVLRRAFGTAETATDEYVRDPLSYNVPTDMLLSKQYAKTAFDMAMASMPKGDAVAVRDPKAPAMELAGNFKEHDRHSTDTDHIVAVDKDGNMASLTHSVYGSTFATGLVVDGIAMNSGNNFPGNTAGPGRRVLSPFPPTMVEKDGKPWLAIGSPGLSSRAVAITLVNLLGYGKTLEQAVDAPRFQGSQAETPMVIETRVPQPVRDRMRTVYGVQVRPTMPYMWHFGSVQAIQRQPDGTLLGVADPRRAGSTGGY